MSGPDFSKAELIPVIAQDAANGDVLMLAYMNEEAYAETLKTGRVCYFSRSRQKLWHKGGTSGFTQEIVEIKADCDQDALVLRVRQNGPGCCHAGYQSCFYRTVTLEKHQTDGDKALTLTQNAKQSYDPASVYG